MPAPKGNHNGRGAKGRSGRKSRYVELQDAHWHKGKWEIDEDVTVLAEKIASRKYSVRDMFLYKALIGRELILLKFADKLLADLHDLRTPEGLQIDLIGEAKKRSEKYLD